LNSDPRLPLLSLRLSGAVSPLTVVALARRAEEAGFTALWVAENPFERGALPAAAAAAAATSRLEIGVGVVNPHNRHPTLIAMEFAALDELSRGRALLGIGAGIGAAIERMGHFWDRPTSAVEEAIHIVRALLRGEEVSYRGRVFRVEGAKLGFRPPRPEMPICMAAVGDNSLRLCARVADGLIISNLSPLAYTERAVGIVRETARGLGRSLDRVVQYVPCAVRPRRAEARETAKRALGALLVQFWRNAEGRPARRAAIVGGSGIGEEEFAACVERLARGEAAEAVLDDRFVAAFAIAGTAEDCLERAASYRRAGVTELALGFLGPEPERDIETLGHAWP
jgi:5,10-methylenetetrahydromethanopterin reductase